jgi:hypothetical protein
MAASMIVKAGGDGVQINDLTVRRAFIVCRLAPCGDRNVTLRS